MWGWLKDCKEGNGRSWKEVSICEVESSGTRGVERVGRKGIMTVRIKCRSE